MNRRIPLQMLLAWVAACCALPGSPALAQEQFELVAPQLNAISQATLTASRLTIVSGDGSAIVYTREPRLDSTNGQWMAYIDRRSRQVIRWPQQATGRFQIGTIQGGDVSYRESQMEIRPLNLGQDVVNRDVPLAARSPQERNSQRLVLPEPASRPAESPVGGGWANLRDQFSTSSLLQSVHEQAADLAAPELLRLAVGEASQEPWFLARDDASQLRLVPPTATAASEWYVAPAGQGYVRLETYSRGRVFAISTTRNRDLTIEPLTQDARQLWSVRRGRGQGGYLLESVFFPGWCLTQAGRGNVALQPIGFVPQQIWFPLVAPLPPTFDPFWRSISREIHPNSQLPPAELQLDNSHRNALFVLVGDSRQGNGFESYRIDPASSITLSLDRDAGATLVETVEIRSVSGVWDRQELVTAIPPVAHYDVSVYEEHLQSIAIDRTGKSPNPIEDINYVPKSIGWFPLPPGTGLPTRGSLDAFQQAKQANNPGAVRRLDPRQFDEPSPLTPAEALLQEFQSTPRRSF